MNALEDRLGRGFCRGPHVRCRPPKRARRCCGRCGPYCRISPQAWARSVPFEGNHPAPSASAI